VNASGTVSSSVTVLLSPEEIDEVARMTFTYRPPGGVTCGRWAATARAHGGAPPIDASAPLTFRPGRPGGPAG